MQGLWSTHRRAKVNLNSTSTPVSGPTTPSAPPAPEEPTTDPTPTETPLDTPAAEAEPATTSTDSKPVSTKRKLRSTREDGSKRAKLSGGAGVSKDHTPPTTRLSDLGGVDACIEKMLELVAMPLCHPEIYLHTGVQPPRGVLLHGPPGCGKTMLAHAIAGVSSRSNFVLAFRLPSCFFLRPHSRPSWNAPPVLSALAVFVPRTHFKTCDEFLAEGWEAPLSPRTF